jgi:hypothetical protein
MAGLHVSGRYPLYDGTTAAINPALPTEINPPITPATDGLTKLTAPVRGLRYLDPVLVLKDLNRMTARLIRESRLIEAPGR